MRFDRESAIVSVDAERVGRVLPFAADRDVRFYLNGVHVQPSNAGGALITATDGHALYCLRDPNGKAERAVILPLSQRKHGRHLKPDHQLFVSGEGQTWVDDRTMRPLWVSPDPLIDNRFPDVSTLVGSLDGWGEGLRCEIDQRLLSRALAAIDPSDRGIRFFHRGNATGAVLFVTGKYGFGLIMPRRGDDKPLSAIIPPEFQRKAEAAHAP